MQLDSRLAVTRHMYELFGQKSFEDLRSLLYDVKEGYREDGHSHFFGVLRELEGLQIPPSKLAEYDLNIKSYVAHINTNRDREIKLRYYQYLTVLFTEIYLDKYFDDRAALIDNINRTIERFNDTNELGDDVLPVRSSELDKLAFWMATGSGKTLIFHINVLQYLEYADSDPDNVLLITPNEGLTDQHMDELSASNIPCERFSANAKGFSSYKAPTVIVLDIHKLSDEHGEKTVDVEAFDGENLVFVDEGHKGSGGDVWMEYRDTIAEGGFTFEYSATFGQALQAADDPDLMEEYSKSILFDYPYKRFYEDGYGKDYDIRNLREDISEDVTDTWLLGNLLAFYEQQVYYNKNEAELQPYNLEPPLWVFVGGRVNAVYTRHGQRTSDVLTVITFLDRLLQNPEWAIETIRDLLWGNPIIMDPDGNSVFEDDFEYLSSTTDDARDVYYDLLNRFFRIDTPTQIELIRLTEVDDEIAIRATEGEGYFGLINIGDTTKFENLVENNTSIPVSEDRFTPSLFASLDESPELSILLGSKKFIEGWDSYRVSSLGLMNVGKSEGSEVIQLFGRGVRLHGKDYSLKRTSQLPAEDPPDGIEILETLRIFGIEAQYMDQFQEYLKQEGIEPEYWEKDVNIEVQSELVNDGLSVPTISEEPSFKKRSVVELSSERDISPTIDRRLEIEVLQSRKKDGDPVTETESPVERTIPDSIIQMLDWNEIYFEIKRYARENDFSNLIIDRSVLRTIIEDERYELHCPESDLEIQSVSDVRRIQRIVETILRSYVSKFYRDRRQTWESRHLTISELDESSSMIPGKYTLSVPKSAESTIEQLRTIFESITQIYEQDVDSFPNIYLDRHIYQPLLYEDSKISISPNPLNEGEKRFIEQLRDFVESDHENIDLSGNEVYVMRNIPRIGMGFFEADNFYPDFVLWVKSDDNESIIFIDPKGLQHIGMHHPKIEFYDTIKSIEERIDEPSISLDSYIISTTSFEAAQSTHGLSRDEFHDRNVYFFDEEYLERILTEAVDPDPA